MASPSDIYNTTTTNETNTTNDTSITETTTPQQTQPMPLLSSLRNTQYKLRPTDTHGLDNIDNVLERYRPLIDMGGDGLLKLAREAVFGINIMANSTPQGTKKKNALPQQELFLIKNI